MPHVHTTTRGVAGPNSVIARLGILIGLASSGCSGDAALDQSLGSTPANGVSDTQPATAVPVAGTLSTQPTMMVGAPTTSTTVAASGTADATQTTIGAETAATGPSDDAGTAGASSESAAPDEGSVTAAQPDCSPETTPWPNPGQVEVPMLKEVEASAGKGVPFDHPDRLDEYAYTEREFFFSGTSPAFTSRFVVLRPSDPAKFSGTVFVEWYNVSGGFDVPVMWSASQQYIAREGHAYVGVTAQQVGANSLKDVDATRYASINHPGDNAANAIFSRAGVALRTQVEMVLGPCMKPKAVIALGQSQSSGRLTDYVNNVQATDQVYDAILLHSGGTPPTSNPSVPVFVVQTMNEGNGSVMDLPNMVEWEVAGASHNDKRLTEASFDIVGKAAGFDENPIACMNPMNDYPAFRVYNTVLDWLSRWVRDGERPPQGAPFETAARGIAFDENMNAKGGVRLPDLDVPIKSFTNSNGPANPTDVLSLLGCGLAGSAVPFTPEKLKQLYPTHDDYVRKYTAAADKALMGGYLLQADYDEMVEAARAAPIPE